VVYHGAAGWTAARRIEELIGVPAVFADYQVRFGFPLLDLSRMSDEEIRGAPILQSVLRLLKYGRGERLPGKYADILRLMARSLTDREVKFWLEAFGVYVMAVNQNMNLEDLDQIVQSVFPTQIEPGSIADRLIKQSREEGWEEGSEKGILAGRIQTLQEMLGDQVSSKGELLDLDVTILNQTTVALQERLRRRQ